MPVWLSDQEYATLRAACAQGVPSGEGTPGAEEAGVADYIDGFLGAFTFYSPRIWAGGPTSGRKGGVAGFAYLFSLCHPWTNWPGACVSRAPRAGQSASSTVRSSVCRSATGRDWPPWAPDFPEVDGREQRRRLRADEAFCELLWEHCCEGHVRAPEYGGNRDTVDWAYIDYEGDVQPRVTRDAEVSQP